MEMENILRVKLRKEECRGAIMVKSGAKEWKGVAGTKAMIQHENLGVVGEIYVAQKRRSD